ncbi:putative 40S ribosomal protein S11 [Gregarina niphandrodes]|uniref:Small ribosomal subunit protein uS17 n=1 Tax=Gregarina niphandrodes TaxID=110365 RepID=A0A023BDR1_GRENI|nr:putative 40S ribosomal protein S11 [Gregarina niphandrodes]EZG89317.1 putative 40S ribosomal protein S11 [Gregarina niphandrodes]|eukprot:XP_011128490.1 putative 40S ribosomal protein S11 [Gregarina niphandrodes]
MAVHVGALEQQNERAYQKQHIVRANGKKSLLNLHQKGQKKRVVHQVGMGFTIPRAAQEGTYIDNKCPFTGHVAIRGRILKGMIVSAKMKRTVVIRRHYLHYIPKYNRFEKRHTNLNAHISPCFEYKEGDIVTIGECRPISKTVSFNVLNVEPKQIFGAAKKQFCLY